MGAAGLSPQSSPDPPLAFPQLFSYIYVYIYIFKIVFIYFPDFPPARSGGGGKALLLIVRAPNDMQRWLKRHASTKKMAQAAVCWGKPALPRWAKEGSLPAPPRPPQDNGSAGSGRPCLPSPRPPARLEAKVRLSMILKKQNKTKPNEKKPQTPNPTPDNSGVR